MATPAKRSYRLTGASGSPIAVDVTSAVGSRPVVVLTGPVAGLVERVTADPNQQKGEFVVMVAGREEGEDERMSEGLRVFGILKSELPPAKAAKLAAAITGAPRKGLYGA